MVILLESVMSVGKQRLSISSLASTFTQYKASYLAWSTPGPTFGLLAPHS